MPTHAATPELARLRSAHPAPELPRVLLHLGTCGHAVGSPEAGEALRAALGERASMVVEAACDGACWAAPAATVERDGHIHRHARLDQGLDEVLACASGDCAAEAYA